MRALLSRGLALLKRVGALRGTTAARRLRGLLVLGLALAATWEYGGFLERLYPVREWLLWPVGLLWLYAALLSAGCVGLGSFVVRRALRLTELPALETLVLSAAVGLVGFCLLMYAGGALHLFRPSFALALPFAMFLPGIGPLRALARREAEARRASPPPAPRSLLGRAALALVIAGGVVAIAFVYLGVLTPDALNFDATWCHVPVGQDYARAGRLLPFDGDYARNVPHLASFVYAWGFLVPGLTPALRWMLALHLEFSLFLWTLAGVAAAVRWFLTEPGQTDASAAAKAAGAWTVFFLFPAIFIYDSNLGGAADHVLAFFAAPMFLATARAAERADARSSVLMGVIAGGGILTKYQGVYLLAGVGLVYGARWLWALVATAFWALARWIRRVRRTPASSATAVRPLLPGALEQLVLAPLSLGVALTLTVLPHFLKNWVFHGNPVYPFAQAVFTGSHPVVPDADLLFEHLFKDHRWTPNGTLLANLREASTLFFTYSFKPHYSFVNKVPVVGSLFTLTLPLILVIPRPGRLWIGLLASFGSLFVWALTFQVDRHLQCFTPLLVAVAAAVVLRAWQLGWLARLGLAPLLAVHLNWTGSTMFLGSAPERFSSSLRLLGAGIGGGRDDRFRFRQAFLDVSAALPPDARVVLHTTKQSLGIDRELYLDIPGFQGLLSSDGLGGPRAFHDYLRGRGVTHVLDQPGYTPCHSKQQDILYVDFERRNASSRRNVGGFAVFALPDAPPPPDAPYRVATFHAAGYRDGLYALEDLRVKELLPRELLVYPPPRAPLPAEDEGARALLDQATAVVLGSAAKLSPPVRAALDRDFLVGVSYGAEFSIYLRR